VKALEYSPYDINRYHFWTAKLEASHQLVATSNSGVVTSIEYASKVSADYYGVLQQIIEYTFGSTKEMKVMFFECDWFDPINDTRVDDFGMVEVKHKSLYSGNNILLAYQAQQMYYLSYPHQSYKNWWVVYKVNPEIQTRRYGEYVKGQEEEDVIDVYQEQPEEHQNFTVSDGLGLTEFPTHDVELIEEEEKSPPKKRLQKSQCIIERKQRRE
jgi:hypothetical protein